MVGGCPRRDADSDAMRGRVDLLCLDGSHRGCRDQVEETDGSRKSLVEKLPVPVSKLPVPVDC